MTAFERALELVLRHEGGYVNDPHDPGGETKYGISKRAYPNEDIRNMTQDRAAQIYRADYWTPIRGNDLPESVAPMVFSMAVNMGVRVAIKHLQYCLGVQSDGIIGPKTLAALDRASVSRVRVMLLQEWILGYTDRVGFPRYGRGWVRRAVETFAETA